MIGQSMATDFYWDEPFSDYDNAYHQFDQILPQDLSEEERCLYIPAGTEQGYWRLGMEMRGVEQSYTLQGIWNDQGVHKILYDNEGGFTEAEFIRHFGKGAAESRGIPLAEGQELAVTGGKACLSEPAGFQSYQWYGGSSMENRLAVAEGTDRTLTPALSPGETAYYRCEAVLLGQSFSLGENFAVTRKQLPRSLGIRLEVQPE